MSVGIANESKQEKGPDSRGKPITFTSDGKVLSCIYDDQWDFIGLRAKGNGKTSIVSFDPVEPEYKQAIQETLSALHNFLKDKNFTVPSVSRLNNSKRSLNTIARALGSTRWSLIDDDREFKQFNKQLKNLELTIPVLWSISSVLEQISDMLSLERHNFMDEFKALARTTTTKQSVAIPIKMYSQILAKSISHIETYYPYRHEIERVMREAYEIRERVYRGENILSKLKGHHVNKELSMTGGAVCRRYKKACEVLIEHDIPDFDIDFSGRYLGRLQGSCLIVTLAFSGVRIGEGLSLNKDSYSTKKSDKGKSISVLSGETTKGNDGIPKKATWQTHFIVKDALELLQCVSEPIRNIHRSGIEAKLESGECNIDQYRHWLKEIKSAFVAFGLREQRERYVLTEATDILRAALIDMDVKATREDVEDFDLLNPTREGELKVGCHLPKFSPHDFRRTFAVFYRRYNFGTSSGIKFQYKHQNINMSDYYANNADLARMMDVLMDNDLLQIMKEEGINLGVDIYDDIYNGSEHLSGIGGESIAQDKFEKVKAGHHVYMDRTEIDSLIRSGSLSVVQLPTGGYCTNPSCERACGSGWVNKCGFQVNTDKTAKQMAQQRGRLIVQFKGLNTGDTIRNSILVGIKQKIKDIENMLNVHEIEYQPFNDRVEGLINDGQA